MRAFAIDAFNTPGSIRDLPTPSIGPDDVLIHIRAASINPSDLKIRQGEMQGMMEHRFPVVLGWDGAGVVEQVGSAVTQFAKGDEVFGLFIKQVIQDGTFAEYASIPASAGIARKPTSLDFIHAAALPETGLTALNALDAVDLKAGQTILIIGATGGIGSYAVQVAAKRGAHVLATARPEKADYIRKLGASKVIDHTSSDLVTAVRAAHPDGIDAIVDVVSNKETNQHNAQILRKGGHLASTIYAADPEQLAAQGISAVNVQTTPSAQQLTLLAQMVDKGDLAVPVDQTFPLEEAGKALDELKQGRVRGKIVLTIS